MTLDETHDPALQSWVVSANGHADFPIQNLPLGIFSPAGATPRAGIAIGESILDLGALLTDRLLTGQARVAAEAAEGTTLNALLALGAGPRRALRQQISALLARRSPARDTMAAPFLEAALHEAGDCVVHLPVAIGDYTDFYAGIHHAENVGRLFRPDAPLLPNYKHIPIGYHGRASSVRASGAPVCRPWGQLKAPDSEAPVFAPTNRLDYELELGIWIGPGNAPGEAIPVAEAADHIAGYCLLNDWSARDIQAWEYQPLGPFLAKSFATTISPWIITPEALAPFRMAQPGRAAGDPRPMAYLWDGPDQASGALDLTLEVFLLTEAMRRKNLPPHRLAQTHAGYLYWTPGQMLAHHASNGCNLRPGDLFGSGTISGPEAGSFGSLLEATVGGRTAVALAGGETRRFLEAGDEIVFEARAMRAGFASIGFGQCRGAVIS